METSREIVSRNEPRSYFICRLEDRDLLVGVINVGNPDQNVLVIVDPTKTEITVESQAWKYIEFLYNRFIGNNTNAFIRLPGMVNEGNMCFANAAVQSVCAMDDLNGDSSQAKKLL